MIQAIEERNAPAAVVVEGIILASGLHSDDVPFVAQIVAAADERAAGELCQQAFDLGVTMLRIADNSADVVLLADRIQSAERAITAASRDSVSSLTNTVETILDPETGELVAAVSSEVDRLESSLTAIFDDADPESGLSQIRNLVTTTVRALATEIVDSANSILDPSDEQSPMHKISREIARDIVEPMRDLTASVREVKESVEIKSAVASEQQKGTAKGRKYEEVVQTSLEEFAAVTGDLAEAVGDLPGADGSSRVGDHLVTFTVPGRESLRIVLEAKDKKLSMAKVREELNQACENRLADAGVMVFSSVSNAPTASPFMRIAAGRYVVVLDKETPDPLALRVAYQSARIDAIALSSSEGESALDVDGLLADIEDARGMFSILTKMKTALTKSAKGAKEATDNLALLKEQLGAVLDGLESRLQS